MEETFLLAISSLMAGLIVLLHLCWRCCAGNTTNYKDLEEGNEHDLEKARIHGVACQFENESKLKCQANGSSIQSANTSTAFATQTVRGIVFDAVSEAIQSANLKIAQEIEDLKHASSVHATMFASLTTQTPCDSKEKNIIIFGLLDSPFESSFHLGIKLDFLVWRKIGASRLFIEDAYRLGTSTLALTKTRPVLVKFLRTIDCQNVLKKRNNLNGTGIQIKPDRPKEKRELHRVFWKKFQELQKLDGELTKFHVRTDGIMTVWKNELPVKKFSYHPDKGVVELFLT